MFKSHTYIPWLIFLLIIYFKFEFFPNVLIFFSMLYFKKYKIIINLHECRYLDLDSIY